VCAGKSPKIFLQARHTLKIIANLSDRLGVQQDKLAIPFVSGPYKGTWVHRDLALRLAEYCDDTCQLETAVGQAIRALADRTPAAAAPAFPAPPPVESFPVYQQLHAEAQGMALIVAVKERDMALNERDVAVKERDVALREKQLAMHPDLLAAKKRDYRAKEKHSAEMGSIKATNEERTAAVKRKAQAAEETEKLERFKRITGLQAVTTAKKDNQDRLRSWGSSIHLPLGNTPSGTSTSRGTSAGGSGLRLAPGASRGCSASSTSFLLSDAARRAASQLHAPEGDVLAFMSSRRNGKTMYQEVIGKVELRKVGSARTQSKTHGFNEAGLYCRSKFDQTVKWVETNYKPRM